MSKRTFSKVKFNQLAAASTFTMVMAFLSLLSNTVIVGNMLGEDAISGVNLITPFLGFGCFAATIISVGSKLIYSREIGKLNSQRANEIFGQAVILSIGLGIVIIAVLLPFGENFIACFDVSPSVAAEAMAYLEWTKYYVATYPINFVLYEFVYADGDVSICNISNAVMIVGGVVLSILFTGILGNSGGAALGTFIGCTVSTLFLAYHFFRPKNMLRFVWHISGKDIIECTKLSMVDAVAYLCLSGFALVFNLICANMFADEYMPVAALILNLLEFTFVFDGVGEAMMPVGEVYLGEGNRSSEKALAEYAMKIAVTEGIALMVLTYIAAPVIPGFYDITTPQTVETSIKAIRIAVLYFPLVAVTFMLTSQYLIARRIVYAMSYAASARFIMPSVCAYVLAVLIGTDGLWLSFLISGAITILIFAFAAYFKYGKEQFPWLVPADENPVLNLSFDFNDNSLMATCEEIESFLKENGIAEKSVLDVRLLAEEFGKVIFEHNRGMRRGIGEFSVMLKKDVVRLYIRDNGVPFNLTDADSKITSLASYTASRIITKYKSGTHLLTVSFNRNIFDINVNRKENA